jgi:hypothetical protein
MRSFTRDAQLLPFHFVYVTPSKPNHPRLFKESLDLHAVAVEEVWGMTLLSQPPLPPPSSSVAGASVAATSSSD